MSDQKLQRAVSRDGTEIVGRIHGGDGPPLVFLSSALGDDTTSWHDVALALSEDYRCLPMSTRGRGGSGDHPDHSPQRLVEDVTGFVESIDLPVGLVGHSSSGALALEVASRCPAVSAVAVYEPTLFELAGEEFAARAAQALGRVGALGSQGRMREAALAFFTDLAGATPAEMDQLLRSGAVEQAARYIPVAGQEAAAADPIPPAGLPRFVRDLSVLDEVAVPALVLHGSRSHAFWADVADELVRRIPHAELRELAGVAHFAPLVAAPVVAAELRRFFGAVVPAREGS